MRIKYSEITVDSVFHLPCGCGFPEDVEITDIPEELIARIDQLSADTNKTVLSPADISDLNILRKPASARQVENGIHRYL